MHDEQAAIPVLNADRLIDLLGRQVVHYRRLRELSERQRALIAGDRPETLLSTLSERQAAVAALALLNQELAPYRRNWDAMYARLPAAHREQAAALLEEINDALRTILRGDQEDGALLAARKQLVANELSGLSGGRAANAAYARHGAKPVSSAADLNA